MFHQFYSTNLTTNDKKYLVSIPILPPGVSFLCVLSDSSLLLICTVRQKAVVILKPNWTKLFRGDTVLLRCTIPGELATDWEYIWYKNEEELIPYKAWTETNEYKNVGPVDEPDGGEYACLGMRKVDSVFSEISDAVLLSVSGLCVCLTLLPKKP